MDYTFEQRLEGIREEARLRDYRIAPGPAPAEARGLPALEARAPGYFGLPVVLPPVWKWQIPLYFFIGGLAGMAAVIALGGMIVDDAGLIRTAMWIAAAGGILSPILLTWDLGRPLRFINMLRVFKPQSPMSVGSWIVSAFGASAIPGAVLTEFYFRTVTGGSPIPALQIGSYIFVAAAALAGMFLGTYTGVLIAVTAIPVWHFHRRLLPIHFGIAGLGSAAALLVLIGFRHPALIALGIGTAAAETALDIWVNWRASRTINRPLHHGTSGALIIASEILAGPLALALWVVGLLWPAGISFLLGALVSRFGWLQAGRASARDPEAIYATQRVVQQ